MSNIEQTVLERPAEARVQRLRRATGDLHEALDRRISEAGLFSNRDRYALFLTLQRRFHAEIDALYGDPRLLAIAPDLAERRRLALIDQDLADLGFTPPLAAASTAIDPVEGLGWLYVSEGSNLGAAFLLKEAAKIGLDENFGARHLAPHPEGRGLNWRRFTQAVDAAELTPGEDARVEAGAVDAFNRVRAIVEETLTAA